MRQQNAGRRSVTQSEAAAGPAGLLLLRGHSTPFPSNRINLWLAPPDSRRLPESWRNAYRAVEPGTVRGGIRGQNHDETRRAFERRQAADLGMRMAAA